MKLTLYQEVMTAEHIKKKSTLEFIWYKPIQEKDKWYLSVGQGMGGAINIAVNKEAYILSDRSTWLVLKIKKTCNTSRK